MVDGEESSSVGQLLFREHPGSPGNVLGSLPRLPPPTEARSVPSQPQSMPVLL